MAQLKGVDPYPYDRLEPLRADAQRLDGGVIDLSVGTPCDDPPQVVVDALAGASGALRGYPPSIGSLAFREAAATWMGSYLGVGVAPQQVGACVGTKEFVASLPGLLKVLQPERDTVLYPEISYPTYAMGATLAGGRAVPVRLSATGGLDLDSIDPVDAARALCLWVNSPANPTGARDDLAAAAEWGRARGVPVFSDECYVAFTWDGPPQTILASGVEGVIAVHSLSKRSNLAGLRVGFYAGDPEWIEPLQELRKHAGLMVPGPAQHAGALALGDEEHVAAQRERYWTRLVRLRDLLGRWGLDAPLPAGGFYLWVPVADAWTTVTQLAQECGLLASPGEFYGPGGSSWVRFAVVARDSALDLLESRVDARRAQRGQ